MAAKRVTVLLLTLDRTQYKSKHSLCPHFKMFDCHSCLNVTATTINLLHLSEKKKNKENLLYKRQ